MSRVQSRSKHSRRHQRGLTLIEVMISLVILAIGLLGVAAVQVRAITEGSSGQNLSNASAAARSRIETLSRTDWSDADLNDTGGAWSAPNNVPVMGINYAISDRITDNNALNPTIKSIEVRAVWNDERRQGRTVVLSSARLREAGE